MDLGSAAAVAYQNLTGQSGLVGQLLMTSDMQKETNPRLAAARARWHKCMLQAGFDYNAPEAASRDPRWASPSGPEGSSLVAPPTANRPLEIQVATADARCEAKEDYAGLEVALLTAYQDQLINSHLAALTAFKAEEQRLVANATAVLKGRTP